MDLLDRPGPLRPDDAFDVGKADAFLKLAIPGLEGAPEVRQFPGGASNLTYLLSYPGRDLVLRRPPAGTKARSAHDMIREARVLAALRPACPWVPRVLAICGDEAVLGAPFFAMAPIPGIILRRDPPAGLALDPARTRRLCLNVVDRLVDLHRVAWRGTGLEDLGRGEGYVQRQVEGWMARYRAARTPDAADFEVVMAWLWRTRPERDAGTCVIHNDYRFDNVVLDPENPEQVVGVLDWEMATLGDPLMDLGNSLAYWVQADDDRSFLKLRRQPTHLPGMLTRDEVVAHYRARTGLDTSGMRFYLAFGLFRLAAIVQQIYARFAAGQATNPEFSGFALLTHILDGRCKALMREAP